MSKLNPKGSVKVPAVQRDLVQEWYSKNTSANGNPQQAKEPEQLLFEIVTSCKFGSDTAFASHEELMRKLHDAITMCVRYGRQDFVANLCVYARREADMRTMPIVALVMFAEILRANGVAYAPLRKLVSSTIKRADEPLDLFSYALSVFGGKKNVPKAIKRGVGDSLNRFDEYAFQKYDRKTGLKFKDLLRIVHPTPKNKFQSNLFSKIMTGTLTVAKTHEVLMSASKAVAEEKGVTQQQVKSDNWAELIKEDKLGYMAAIRNVANICTDLSDQDAFGKYLDLLKNDVAIKKSSIFPYQVFLPLAFMSTGSLRQSLAGLLSRSGMNQAQFSATLGKFDAIPAARKNLLISTLGEALDKSVSNVPDIGDNVVIYLDTSGSMRGVLLYVLPLVAALVKSLRGKNFALVGFDSTARVIPVDTNASAGVICNGLREHFNGGSTHLRRALAITPAALGFTPNTAILISDMQINSCAPGDDVKSITEGSQVLRDASMRIAINLSAADNSCVLGQGWYNVSGYSDSIFDLMAQGASGANFEQVVSQYTKWRGDA
jgi:hypothetical protein